MTAYTDSSAARGPAMRAAGYWIDKTMDEFLVESMRQAPDKTAIVAHRVDRSASRRLTYRELGDMVARCAGALREMGVMPGDVVSVQLPNWWEFVVTAFACGRIGAVVNPLMPIFRERELRYMLGFAQSKVLIVPQMYRGFDHAAMATGLAPELPNLRHIVVVDSDAQHSFDGRMLQCAAPVTPTLDAASAALQPDDVSVMVFTSGTTGDPKGVMHSSNTLLACLNALRGRFGLAPDDVLLCATPVGHMTGYAAVMMLAVRLGGTMVLQDVWDSARGVALMAEEAVTYTAASTPFLTDICDTVAAGAPRPQELRAFLCGGAPIPPTLIERAARELDLAVCSLWGMTEALSGTLTEPQRAAEKSSTTDGRPLEGMEVLVADAHGQSLPVGQTGRLLVRGAQVFLGYFKRPDLPAYDADGWFDTGDLAYMDAEGYIRINGRTKDVLIRGGENVPVFEIESLLVAHPALAAAAVVGYPDRRLGERACAFVVLKPGASFDLAALQAHMAQSQVAKQYWPERVRVVEELPRTPTGKIQKFRLREIAASETPAS
jgi:cyclohexanecarboxylate-CoA ligase